MQLNYLPVLLLLICSSLCCTPLLAQSQTQTGPPSNTALSSYETTDSLSNYLDKLLDEEAYEEVIATAKKAELMDARGFFYCGLAYYFLDKDALAIEQFDKSLKLEPDAPGPHYYKATISLLNGKHELAMTQLDQGLKVRPTDGDLMALKGRVFSLMGESDSALLYWEATTKLSKFPATLYNDLGNLYFDRQLSIKAREMYQRSMSYLPEGSPTWIESAYNLGIIDYRRGDYQSAGELYREIIKQAPSDYGAIERLIQVYYAQEAFEQADELKDRLLKAYQDGVFDEEYSFRIDRFNWKGYNIFVHERFLRNGDFREWTFYLVNPEGDILEQVSTDLNPSPIKLDNAYVFEELGQKMVFDFQEEVDYKRLKEAAIKVLSERLKERD